MAGNRCIQQVLNKWLTTVESTEEITGPVLSELTVRKLVFAGRSLGLPSFWWLPGISLSLFHAQLR